MNEELIEISKYLSYALRHRPLDAGITLTKDGWTNIDVLIDAIRKKGLDLTKDKLLQIVEQNNKKRFTISDDGVRIRAAQGHSTKLVNLKHKEITPPPILYHGTASKFIKSIMKKGLIPKSRHHVHLSIDIKTATNVAIRHGNPVILTIDTTKMLKDGHKFYLSENNVWLTDAVPLKYLTIPKISHEHTTTLSL